MENRVALIIVNHNSGDDLKHCLEAVQAQTRSPDRLIVVDNASTDASLSAEVRDRFSTVEWVFNETNVGFGAANNQAVRRAADCGWVVLLNPDTRVEPLWLENLLRGAAEHPDHAFFGCHMVSMEVPERLDGTGDVYHISGLAWRRDHGKLAHRMKRPAGEIFSPCAAAALYQRKAFEEAGGFDEEFFAYFEDVDLGFRLRLRGYRCLYLPEARLRHRGGGSFRNQGDRAVYLGQRNLVWSYFTNMPALLFWGCLPLFLLQNLAAVAWLSLQGKPGVILKSKWDAVCGLGAILRKRKTVQRTRTATARELFRSMERNVFAPLFKL